MIMMEPSLSVSPLTSTAANAPSDWLLWQLVDSALPTGGFAHSAGLEAACQHGEVRNRVELFSFLEASLYQLGRAALPLVTAAFDSPEDFDQFDHLCDVFISNHVANRASRLQGKSFLAAVERIFPEHGKHRLHESPASGELADTIVRAPLCHFAPVFGGCLRRLSVPRKTVMRIFFFSHLRGLIAAAVRLNIVGPMEAQAMQYRLSAKAEEVLTRFESLTLDDLAQTAPLHDLWQGSQDRLYSRLFQS